MAETLAEIRSQNFVFSLADLKVNRSLMKEIQSRLHSMGLYDYKPGDPDGWYGPRTELALERFCRHVHLNCMDTGLFGASFATALLTIQKLNSPGIFTLPDWWQGGSRTELARAIAKEGQRQGIRDRNQLCYIMATIQHETAHTYRPIAEYGGKRQRYAPYYGRGYVQLTWEYNYRKYSQLLNQDFVKYPDQVMQPDISLFIIVHGMINGTFTGKKLADYINGDRLDFNNARRIINGTDRMQLVANYARQWQQNNLF